MTPAETSSGALQAAAEHAARARELLAGDPCRCGDTENCPYEDRQQSTAQLAQAHAATGQLYATLAACGLAAEPPSDMQDALIRAAGKARDSTGLPAPRDAPPTARRETRTAGDPRPRALRELAGAWRAYIPTPDNDYADGVQAGLSEAADDLDEWLRQFPGPAHPGGALAAIGRILACGRPPAERDPRR